MKKEIDAYESSDYAGLLVGEWKFYFGYEKVWCDKHQGFTDKPHCSVCEIEGDEDGDDEEWAFFAHKGDDVLAKYKQSDLENAVRNSDSMSNYLLAGIAKMLKEGKLKV